MFRERDIRPKQKPAKGDTVMDMTGTRYKVVEVGLKYAKLETLDGKLTGMVPYANIFPVPKEEVVTVERSLDEEFLDFDNEEGKD